MFLLTVKSSCALLVGSREQADGVFAVTRLNGSDAAKEDEHVRHFVGSLGRLHVSQVEWQNALGAHVLPAASLNPSGQSLTH